MNKVHAVIALVALNLLAMPVFAATDMVSTSESKNASNPTAAELLHQVYLDQAEVDRVTAIIKSKADLKRYLAHTPSAPLNKLPLGAKRGFIDRLVFTSGGLGSYSYVGLTDYLTTTEIYQTLSLFGVQKSMGAIPRLKSKGESEQMIATLSFDNCDHTGPEGSPTCPGKPKTKTDHVCADDWLGDGYKCHYSFGDVCTSSCGK